MPPSVKFTLDPALFNRNFYASILRFWLPTYPNPTSKFTQADVLRWFASSATTDEEVRTLAGEAISSLSPENLPLPPFVSLEADRDIYDKIAAPFIPHLCNPPDESAATQDIPTNTNAYSALALAILLDQFPRNLFRGAAQAVVYTHYDRLSRAVAAQIHDLNLSSCFANAPVWRYWFYLPLEHSESVSDHDLFRCVLGKMLEQARMVEDETVGMFVERARGFEEKHWVPLRQFGRFPWRNRWLGRKSTEEERKWLEAGGDRFGTG
jgi:uncharacterized protein (DUF924 family)